MARIIEISNPFEPWKVSRQYEHAGGVTIRGWLEETYPDFKEFAKPTYCVVNGQPMLRAEWLVYKIKPGDVVGFVVTPGDPVTWLYILYAVLVIATIAIALSLPKPGTPTDAQADTVYFLKGQRNQNRLSNPIEVPYGKCRLFPSYAARPWNNYTGNQQYQYSLYCLGQGEYDIHSIQYEDTPIGDFDDIEYEVYGPGTPATLFPDNVVTSSEVANIELFGTNEPEYVIAGPFTANESGTLTDLLQVDVSLPLGLYYGQDDGSLGYFTVTAKFEYREIDDSDNPVGAGTWLTLADWSVTMKTSTPQRFTLELSVAPGRYQVRALRIGDHDQRPRISNTIVWDALRAFLPSVQNYPNVTLIAVKAKATNGLNDGTSQRFNVWATRKLRKYDIGSETWSAPVATRNPIWAFCDTFQASYGGQLEDRFLALDELCAFAATFDSEGRSFDFVFDTKSTVWDTATIIARVVRARPMMNGSQVTMVRDLPKTIVTAVFTPFNICKGSFKWEIKMAQVGDYDGVEIEYIDPVTWKPETVKCLVGDDAGDNLEQIKLAGCTDREFGAQEGFYIRRCRRLLRENITFQTELEGHLPSYGDLIRVVHDLPRWGTGGLVRSIDGTTVVLSEPVTFTSGNVIGFRKKDGSEAGPFACTAGSDPYTIILGAPLADSFYFDGKHELPLFAFGTANDSGTLCTVVGLAPDDDAKVTVKAVVYNAAIFDGGITPDPDDNGVPNTPTLPQLNCGSLVAGWDPIDLTKARLAWAPALSAVGYRVEVSPDGDNWDVIATNTLETSVLITPDPGQDLYFRVQALGAGGLAGAFCVKFLEEFSQPPEVVGEPNNDYSGEMPLYTPPAASYAYRVVGDTAKIVGFDPYIASTPPKKFLNRLETGSNVISCGGGPLPTFVANQTKAVNPVTEIVTTAGVAGFSCTGFTILGSITETEYNATVHYGPITAWGCQCGSGTDSIQENGSTRYKLSNEDTEEAAITRKVAGLTAITALPFISCAGIFPCAISSYELRTTLYTISFQKAQFQVTLSGMTPGDSIIGFFPIFRRPFSGGSWVQDSVMEFSFAADGSGNYSMYFDIPFERGFQFGAGEAYYRKVTPFVL